MLNAKPPLYFRYSTAPNSEPPTIQQLAPTKTKTKGRKCIHPHNEKITTELVLVECPLYAAVI